MAMLILFSTSTSERAKRNGSENSGYYEGCSPTIEIIPQKNVSDKVNRGKGRSNYKQLGAGINTKVLTAL